MKLTRIKLWGRFRLEDGREVNIHRGEDHWLYCNVRNWIRSGCNLYSISPQMDNCRSYVSSGSRMCDIFPYSGIEER